MTGVPASGRMSQGAASTFAARDAPTSRLDGIDGARAVALVGMLVAHYASSFGRGDPGWLQVIDHVADGRSAPLFCVVLGLGAGILLRRRGAAAVVRRGVVLLVAGLAIWPHVGHVYLILPQYGVLLALMALSRHLPARSLLPLAAACWMVPTIAAAARAGNSLRSARQPDSYRDLTDVPEIAWQLLWSGGYPLAGWTGFALVGVWLSRRRLDERILQLRLIGAGAAVAATQPVMAALQRRFSAADPGWEDRTASAFLETAAHSNRFGWYVLAAGTATAIVAAACALSRRGVLPSAVAATGRHALSAYLLHLLLGVLVIWPWRERSEPSLAAQMAVTLSVAALIGLLAALWSRRFQYGPAEFVVRRLAH